jgi:hypothetical protein
MLLREVLGAETDAELGFASRQGDGIVWDPMHRRRFLAHLAALSSTAMLAPFGVFQAPQRSERLQKVLDGQVRVDDASITELATRVDSFWSFAVQPSAAAQAACTWRISGRVGVQG